MMIVPKPEKLTIEKLERKMFNGFSQLLENTYLKVHLNLGVFIV